MTDHLWLGSVLDDLARYCSNNGLLMTNELVMEAIATLKLEIGTQSLQQGQSEQQPISVEDTRH